MFKFFILILLCLPSFADLVAIDDGDMENMSARNGISLEISLDSGIDILYIPNYSGPGVGGAVMVTDFDVTPVGTNGLPIAGEVAWGVDVDATEEGLALTAVFPDRDLNSCVTGGVVSDCGAILRIDELLLASPANSLSVESPDNTFANFNASTRSLGSASVGVTGSATITIRGK